LSYRGIIFDFKTAPVRLLYKNKVIISIISDKSRVKFEQKKAANNLAARRAGKNLPAKTAKAAFSIERDIGSLANSSVYFVPAAAATRTVFSLIEFLAFAKNFSGIFMKLADYGRVFRKKHNIPPFVLR